MNNFLKINFKFNNDNIGAGLYSNIKNYSDILNIVKDIGTKFKGLSNIKPITSKLESYYSTRGGIVEVTDIKLECIGCFVNIYHPDIINEFTPNGSFLLYEPGFWYTYNASFERVTIDLATMNISLYLKYNNSDDKVKPSIILNEYIPEDTDIKIKCINLFKGVYPGFSNRFKVNFNIVEIDKVISIFKTIDDIIKDDNIGLKCIETDKDGK